MPSPVITFLSDYGHGDEFVGVVHGVIATGCPQARVIDLTHGIGRHDVLGGALALRNALPFCPPGVHLAVVDPGVGTDRRGVAVRCADGRRLLVGPDNGLLSLAAEHFGGVIEAVDIDRSPWRLEPLSATFHGRDLFAPVAARLAAEEPLATAGEPVDPDDLVTIDLPRPAIDGDALVAHVLIIDRFGNAILDASHGDLAGSGVRLGRSVTLASRDDAVPGHFARTFADVAPGEALLYEDAGQALAVAVNRGSAAAALGLSPGSELRIAPGG